MGNTFKVNKRDSGGTSLYIFPVSLFGDDDDDDDDDDDEELLLWHGWPTKWISAKQQAWFEPAQNLSSGLVEWSCEVVITTTP